MRSTRTIFASIAVLLAAAATPAQAGKADGTGVAADGDRIEAAPAEMRGVDITERLGTKLPLEVGFTDDRGKAVKLGDYFGGDMPVVLTFNYSSCPMLCSMQLSSLVATLAKVELVPGVHYQLVTIGLDHEETHARSAETKSHYVSRLPGEQQANYRKAWHFLTGTEAAIRTVADSVGFGYSWVAARKEYAHRTALIMISPEGKVSRYIKGIHYQPADVSASIIDAGLSKENVSLGYALSCFYYDHRANSYTSFARKAMRYGGFAFVVLLFGSLTTWVLWRRRDRESNV